MLHDAETAAPGHFHAVRFYENQASLCRTVGEFLSEGLAAGHPGLVIATPHHREGILAELQARGIDVDPAQTAGNLVVLDARTVLTHFMGADGLPDPELFRTHLIAALERVRGERTGGAIRAYGEMVDVLWQSGRTDAAIRLEMLWNQLAMTHMFSLLCGYAMGSFYKEAGMREICAQHSHVMPADCPLPAQPHA